MNADQFARKLEEISATHRTRVLDVAVYLTWVSTGARFGLSWSVIRGAWFLAIHEAGRALRQLKKIIPPVGRGTRYGS
jgi:hypothetical protein